MFFFPAFSFSVLNQPIIQECSYYNTYDYSCAETPSGISSLNGILYCNESDQAIQINGTNLTCVNSTNQTLILNDTFIDFNSTNILSSDSVTFYDIDSTYTTTYNANYSKYLNDSIKVCGNNTNTLYSACQFLCSACVLSRYSAQSQACSLMHSVIPTIGYNVYEYEFWPGERPFIEYETTMQRVLEEVTRKQSFSRESIVNISMARYSQNGEFLGYQVLTEQLDHCSRYQSQQQLWRIYGSIVNYSCLINLQDMLISSNTDLYDPFLVEIINNTEVLRPIPIIVRNYHDAENQTVNYGSNDRKIRMFRRFFIFDNYTTDDYIQYISQISLNFQSDVLDGIPYFDITYATAKRSDVEDQVVPLFNVKESNATKEFKYGTNYVTDLNDFWFACLVILLVISAIVFSIFLFRCYLMYTRYAQDGVNIFMIIACFNELFSIAAFLMYVVVFIFTIFFYIAFKWVGAPKFTIPIKETQLALNIFVYICTASTCAAVVLRLILQFATDIFIIDWERASRSRKGVVLRQVILANEYIKLSTRRDYNPYIIMTLLIFILKGIKVELWATPISTVRLIDTGFTSDVLRFANDSFFFIMLMIVSFIANLVKNLIFGNPINRFIDLCSTANISFISMITNSWGFYLHGRSGIVCNDNLLASTSDEQELEEIDTPRNGSNDIGSITMSFDDKVFELYMSPSYRESLFTPVKHAADIYKASKLKDAASPNVLTPEARRELDYLNKALAKFYGAPLGRRQYDVQGQPLANKLSGLPPVVENHSMFYIEKNGSFRNPLFSSHQIMMALFDLIIFIVVDISIESPIIAALCSTLCDFVVAYAWKLIVTLKIQQKSLYDRKLD